MSVNHILASLQQNTADDAAVNDVLGMVVLNDELLNQVSGGVQFSGGFFCSVSAECMGGYRCDFWNTWG